MCVLPIFLGACVSSSTSYDTLFVNCASLSNNPYHYQQTGNTCSIASSIMYLRVLSYMPRQMDADYFTTNILNKVTNSNDSSIINYVYTYSGYDYMYKYIQSYAYYTEQQVSQALLNIPYMPNVLYSDLTSCANRLGYYSLESNGLGLTETVDMIKLYMRDVWSKTTFDYKHFNGRQQTVNSLLGYSNDQTAYTKLTNSLDRLKLGTVLGFNYWPGMLSNTNTNFGHAVYAYGMKYVSGQKGVYSKMNTIYVSDPMYAKNSGREIVLLDKDRYESFDLYSVIYDARAN
jgi:hypothetical protein